MSDISRQPRRGFGNILIAMILIVAASGIGLAAFWSRDWSSEPSPRAEASQQAKQDANALEQRMNDLQVSQQQMANQLDEIKRQLAAGQGERKLLSDQVGALSGRVDSLATSAAPGAAAPPAKKRR